MLSENIRNLRKSKGISQEELSVRLNVVRQTVSKWEKGLSVPDSEMLIKIAECLDTTVNVLLGETVTPDDKSELQVLSEKLEVLNEQFARRNENRRRIWRAVFFSVGAISLLSIATRVFIYIQHAVSMSKDISIIGGADGPTAILVGRSLHQGGGFGFFAVALIACAIGIYKTKKK